MALKESTLFGAPITPLEEIQLRFLLLKNEYMYITIF